MLRYFFLSLRTQFSRGRSLFVLSVLGVALGVASVVSIQVLNDNSLAAFRGGIRAISGDADLTVVGAGPAFSDSLYPTVLGTRGVELAIPLYQVAVSLADDPETYLEVVGVDLLAPTGLPVNPTSTPGDDDGFGAVSEALSVPGWVAVTPALAEDRGWSRGDTFVVSSGSRSVRLQVGALVDFQSYAPLASRYLAVMDISQAQALLGRPGKLQQIDVHLAEGVNPEDVRETLQDELGPMVRVTTPSSRTDDAANLLSAFRLNLTALSMISLFVGMFLIFSSTQASLVRRRREIGLLRSLGATRLQVLAWLIGEVAWLGLIGVAVGIPIGLFAATQNVEVVSATLTNIYLLSAIDSLRIPAQTYLLAAFVGIGGAVLGALFPAWDSTRKDPRALLSAFSVHEGTQGVAGRLALAGGILIGLALLATFFFRESWRYFGFAVGLVLLIALPMMTPVLVQAVSRITPAAGFNFSLAIRNLSARLQTTSISIASLAIAVSMMIGVTLLISSFRSTLATWVDDTIRADIYITTESWVRGGEDAFLTEDVLATLRGHGDVAAIETLRRLSLEIEGRPIWVGGVSLTLPDSLYSFPMREGNARAALESIRASDSCLISEPLSRKTKLGVGDSLQVRTPRGLERYPIVGVTYDYSSDGGTALVSEATMSRLFGEGPVQNVALFLAPETDPDEVIGELRAALPGVPLSYRSNRHIREEVFRIFDQTFAITRLLQGMALLVAACGISLTLLVVARERVAELALYRSLGALRRQIFGLFVGEGLGLALLGLVLGTVGGFALAGILVYIINPAFFGWTIRPDGSWAEWAQQCLTILAVAVLASLYPALKASRVPAQELTREDL